MAEPLISICIPTRNRWYTLKHTLNSIIIQKEFLDKKVEIIISDNKSNDETEIEVKKLCKKFENIHYYKNQENIWWNPNIFKALTLWSWTYLRPLWSDDIILKWWLKLMCSAISDNPTLVLSKRCKETDLNEKLEFKLNTFHWFSDFATYVWYNYQWLNWGITAEDRDSFFTFMSIFCYKKDHFKKSYKHLIKLIWEKKLSLHTFNFSLIAYNQLFSSDIIKVLESPRMIGLIPNVMWWTPWIHLYKDLKWEIKYLANNYYISNNCRNALKRLLYVWKMAWILTPIRDFFRKFGLMKIYNFCSERYRRKRWYL